LAHEEVDYWLGKNAIIKAKATHQILVVLSDAIASQSTFEVASRIRLYVEIVSQPKEQQSTLTININAIKLRTTTKKDLVGVRESGGGVNYEMTPPSGFDGVVEETPRDTVF